MALYLPYVMSAPYQIYSEGVFGSSHLHTGALIQLCVAPPLPNLQSQHLAVATLQPKQKENCEAQLQISLVEMQESSSQTQTDESLGSSS